MKRIPPQLKVKILEPLIWLTLIVVPFLFMYPSHRLYPFCECLTCTRYEVFSTNVKLTGFPQLCIESNSLHSCEGFKESEMLIKSYPSKLSVWNDVCDGFLISEVDGLNTSFLQDNKARHAKKNSFFIIHLFDC